MHYDLSSTVLEYARRWCLESRSDTVWGRIPSHINLNLLSVSVGASLSAYTSLIIIQEVATTQPEYLQHVEPQP